MHTKSNKWWSWEYKKEASDAIICLDITMIYLDRGRGRSWEKYTITINIFLDILNTLTLLWSLRISLMFYAQVWSNFVNVMCSVEHGISNCTKCIFISYIRLQQHIENTFDNCYFLLSHVLLFKISLVGISIVYFDCLMSVFVLRNLFLTVSRSIQFILFLPFILLSSLSQLLL